MNALLLYVILVSAFLLYSFLVNPFLLYALLVNYFLLYASLKSAFLLQAFLQNVFVLTAFVLIAFVLIAFVVVSFFKHNQTNLFLFMFRVKKVHFEEESWSKKGKNVSKLSFLNQEYVRNGIISFKIPFQL